MTGPLRLATPAPSVNAPLPAPRWARWTAHSVALAVLPSTIWRLGLASGFRLGYTEDGYEGISPSGAWGPAYLIALSLLSELAALLTLGLVHRWGEVVPSWVPLIGGRPIRRRTVLVPAWLGVGALAVLWTPFLFWWAMPHDDMTPTGHTLVGFVYLPLVAWAPLLAAVTLSYQRRHRPARG
ncbi:hypothetical protein [Spirillospora sp. CA-294931]|uniref:hypothetical protein n=1 Tax=Spirillospora sp. CA-294931 TaxID=3240042 RepID=UPI003D92E2E6